jgi:hypothetical protein
MINKPYYPVGIQSFKEIRKLNAVYVDKTNLIYKLAHGSKYVFLSRPRRFGKTLLVNTLHSYFEGDKDLFIGLAISELEKDWIKYPILHFDFSNPRNIAADDIERAFALKLTVYEDIYGRDEREIKLGERLKGLIKRAYQKTGIQVVLLIDEYDSPLLSILHKENEISSVRNVMSDFYSPLKECDDYLRFVFITGISTFSQLSIFSELNNLIFISRNKEYASICGITKQELIDNFQYGIEQFTEAMNCSKDEVLQILTDYYDGYHFCEKADGIFNPYSLLNAFQDLKLDSYWFASGTPIFLIEMLRKYKNKGKFTLEDLESSEPVSIKKFESPLELQSGPIPLLYQSGYLTIKDFDEATSLYKLGIPNTEVRVGLLQNILPLYADIDAADVDSIIARASYALRIGNIDKTLQLLQSLLASVPFMRGDKEILANTEKTEAYYHRIFYFFFRLLHNEVYAEIRNAIGATDVTIFTPKYIYIIEIKINSSVDIALKQIEDKGYATPYLSDGRDIVKVGVNFSTESRTLSEWKQA